MRSVPLGLFDQDWPDTLDQPNTFRGHSQKALRRIDTRFNQYGCCSSGEPTRGKSLALRFERLHGVKIRVFFPRSSVAVVVDVQITIETGLAKALSSNAPSIKLARLLGLIWFLRITN